jgi:methylenetetrahydrofolate reductase (NADPH)
LTGHLDLAEIAAIFERADSFSASDWLDFAREIQFCRPEEFYLFERDPETGLATDAINQEYKASLAPKGRATLRKKVPAAYRLSRFVHDKLFEPASSSFAAGRWVYARLENHPTARRWLHAGEQASKIGMYDCRDCGDCSLPDIAYLCPESQCGKNQRNGPCGGSRAGFCEVADRECIWARAYDRLKPYGEELGMLDRPPIYTEGSLRGTSAWSNTFLEKDHHATRRKSEGGETGGRGDGEKRSGTGS